MKDEMYGVLIEPNFYSVLKEHGLPSARYASGKYKDETAQTAWIAYLCGKEHTHAQAVLERYPDDETEPHEG